MDMILGDMSFHNFDILCSTGFPDQISDSIRYITFEDRFAIFRNPHEMQMDQKY